MPQRNKLGLFYIQMLRPVGTKTQFMALAEDPGAKYDGVAVASHRRIELRAMVFLPDDVPEKVKARRDPAPGQEVPEHPTETKTL